SFGGSSFSSPPHSPLLLPLTTDSLALFPASPLSLDLTFPLSVLSRFVSPGRHHPVHWTAAVRVEKYLAFTSGMELVLGGTQPVVLTNQCDSSYADDVESQRSTRGYCFCLGAGAGAVFVEVYTVVVCGFV
ncbi:unnamed protein product, partial [Closterium sp. NIES-53]